MSWDIYAFDIPDEFTSVQAIPKDFKPASLGSRAELISKIIEVAPTADFSDPAWGTLDGDGWAIEISLSQEEDSTGFAFHVRGGDGAVGAVGAILDHLRIRAVDAQTGDFFTAGPEALKSFQQWRAYRDQIVGR